ncbi:MAG: hypothetical protein Q4C41_06060 [Eggerthellaceae bacterium]|nr:hypothetical protein [Eggerthellaceae bacterium]
MTMHIMVDETVLMEFVGERRESLVCWNKLNAMQLVGYAELWATPDAYRLMEQEMSEQLPNEAVRRALGDTLSYIEICSVDANVVRLALSYGGTYEEGVLDACVRKVKADYVVTRKKLPPLRSKVPVFTPEALFEHLEKAKGVTFELVDF